MSSHNLLRKQVASELKKRRQIFFTAVILIFLYLSVSFVFGDAGFIRYLKLQKKRDHITREIKEIEEKNALLRTDVQRLRENPFYLEKHAREDFGMARPDEYIFKYDK